MQTAVRVSIAMGVAALVTAAAAAQGPKTVTEVMTVMTIPASDVIFSAAYDTPTTDEGWTEVGRNARILIESGKVLMSLRGDRDEGWEMAATALIAASQAAEKAVQARDGAALESSGDDVYLSCESCHERYWENR